MPDQTEKKHPCPDCKMCQWCSEIRCEMCRGWITPGKVTSPCGSGCKKACDTPERPQH